LDVEALIRSITEYRYFQVTPDMRLADRFRAIRANYETKKRAVDDGLSSWSQGDPYRIADWVRLFTPIEYAAWCEIRCAGLPMWPQFPVGRFFADFANPVARVALECDGKAYHDVAKDAQRDREFEGMGWTVIRAPGSRCMRLMTSPAEMEEDGDDVSDEYREQYASRTMAGIIERLREFFE
jgi:very-short-patch-repair endonuclease